MIIILVIVVKLTMIIVIQINCCNAYVFLIEFALFCKEYFEANWSETGSFWSKAKLSYETWYKKANPEEYEENGLKGFTTEPRFGIPFLIAQLKKSTKLKTPKYKHLYAVAKKDLW